MANTTVERTRIDPDVRFAALTESFAQDISVNTAELLQNFANGRPEFMDRVSALFEEHGIEVSVSEERGRHGRVEKTYSFEVAEPANVAAPPTEPSVASQAETAAVDAADPDSYSDVIALYRQSLDPNTTQETKDRITEFFIENRLGFKDTRIFKGHDSGSDRNIVIRRNYDSVPAAVDGIGPDRTQMGPPQTGPAPGPIRVEPEVAEVAPEVAEVAPEVVGEAPEVAAAPEAAEVAPEVVGEAPEVAAEEDPQAPTSQFNDANCIDGVHSSYTVERGNVLSDFAPRMLHAQNNDQYMQMFEGMDKGERMNYSSAIVAHFNGLESVHNIDIGQVIKIPTLEEAQNIMNGNDATFQKHLAEYGIHPDPGQDYTAAGPSQPAPCTPGVGM